MIIMDNEMIYGGEHMSKGFAGFIGGLITGAALILAYLHRDAICAAVKGEELPEAPDGCPFSDCE